MAAIDSGLRLFHEQCAPANANGSDILKDSDILKHNESVRKFSVVS